MHIYKTKANHVFTLMMEKKPREMREKEMKMKKFFTHVPFAMSSHFQSSRNLLFGIVSKISVPLSFPLVSSVAPAISIIYGKVEQAFLFTLHVLESVALVTPPGTVFLCAIV